MSTMAAALVALLLLSFASVQSIVMQAAMPASGDMTAMCGEGHAASSPASMSMSGMNMGPAVTAADDGHKAPHGHKTACPYCAAAHHAPVIGQAVPLRHASGFVYAVFQRVASHGPRGPPTCEPRARGPPSAPLTA